MLEMCAPQTDTGAYTTTRFSHLSRTKKATVSRADAPGRRPVET